MQSIDLETIDAECPPEVMLGDATVVGYAEVFPWARQFTFTLDGVQWLADDMYCVIPA
jgi:hypothetical protein